MINQFFRTRSWISKITGSITILAMIIGFIPALLLPTPALAASIFSESFGTGNTANDVSGWKESEQPNDNGSDVVAKQSSATSTNSDYESPNGGRFVKIVGDNDEWFCKLIDTTGYQSLTLGYYWRGEASAEPEDFGVVEIGTNSISESACNSNAQGAWSVLASHALDNASGESNQTQEVWALNSVNLPADNDGKFLLRFRNASSADAEYFRVDGVTVEGTLVPTTGSLTVTKTAVGGDGTFNMSGTGSIGAFSLTTVAGTASQTFNNLTPGSFTVTETVPGGWAKTGDTCTSVAVSAGQTATCTITNTKDAPLPQCSDDSDNDEDGKEDYPADPGCESPTDDSESPDPAPETGSIKIVKYACPDDTVLSRTTNGVGGTVPDECVLDEGATFGYTYDTSKTYPDTSGPYPGLSDDTSFSELAPTDESGISLNTGMAKGGRYIIVETDENGDQLPHSAILGMYCEYDGDTNPENNDNQEVTYIYGEDNEADCIAYNKAPTEEPLSCDAEVNLLQNGSFEAPDVATGGYDTFPQGTTGLEWLVDWVSDVIEGIPEIEIQDNVAGAPAIGAGDQFTELDSFHPVKIWQDVPTIPGQKYVLSFKYSPRPGVGSNDVEAWADGSLLASLSGAGGEATNWTSHSYNFNAADGNTAIKFIGADTDDGLGGYLDDVSLNCVECDEEVENVYVSDTATQVDETNASLVTKHPSWTDLAGASWIWNAPINAGVDSSPVGSETFTRTFSIVGAPTGASLDISADNGYTVSVNNTVVCADDDDQNWSSVDTCVVPVGLLFTGTNTLSITVDNFAGPDGYDGPNPGGLIYKLTVTSDECAEDVPPPPVCKEGEQLVDNQCVPIINTGTVTMCKQDEDLQGLSGWTLMLLDGPAVDVLTVPSDSSTGQDSTIPLDADMPYVAVASGVWTNQGGANPADAEYSTVDAWVAQMDGYTGYGTDILELQINEVFDPNSDWGPYNSLHEYAQGFTQAFSGSANFRVFDGSGTTQHDGTNETPNWFGDNTGDLDVTIYKGYAGVTGEDGCVTFKDVPFGNYTVDEIDQEGWTKDVGMSHVDVQVNSGTNNFVVINTQDNEDPEMCSEGYHLDDETDECVPDAVKVLPQCSDGVDNDGDLDADKNDPGCHTDGDGGNDESYDPNDDSEQAGSNGGTHSGSVPSGGGSVLGAFTGPAVLGDSACTEYITDYIKLGWNNDPGNVSRLQTFLNQHLGLNLTISGIFDTGSFNAVKMFQKKYAAEVLAPWGSTPGGINEDGTGFVYKTTKRWINMIKCPELNIPQFAPTQLD